MKCDISRAYSLLGKEELDNYSKALLNHFDYPVQNGQ